jgi:hypothetical protein
MMAMTIEPQQQRQFGAGPFDHMPYSHPHFTNPWAPSSTAPQAHQLYAPSNGMNHNLGLDPLSKQHASRMNGNVSLPPYGSIPVSAASSGSSLSGGSYAQDQLLTHSQDILNSSRMQHANSGYGSDMSYSSAPQSNQSTYATASQYDAMGYAPAPLRSTYNLSSHQQSDHSRRLSQT